MTEPEARDKPGQRWAALRRLRPELPSWLISLVVHLLVLLALGLTLRLAPPRGLTAERTAEVGIALRHEEGDRPYYESGPDAGGDRSPTSEGQAQDPSLTDFLSDQSPVDPTASLPSPISVIGPGVLGKEGLPNAGGLPQGPRGSSGSRGGQGQTSLFGITAEGTKFVYVFDRSESMSWHNQKPLRAAKNELLASLASLDRVHQFQIIFYNEKPQRFNPSGQPGKLAFATEQNKRNAHSFVRGIVASGGTQHQDALMLAIKLQPDVIFFLTDAGDPQLSAGQLYEIQRRAAGITIHVIEFGLGPQRDPNNFLVRLARQNGGQHAYVDISQLPAAGGR
jgi:hypothetical protein